MYVFQNRGQSGRCLVMVSVNTALTFSRERTWIRRWVTLARLSMFADGFLPVLLCRGSVHKQAVGERSEADSEISFL